MPPKNKQRGRGPAPPQRSLPFLGSHESAMLNTPADLDALLQRDHSSVRAVTFGRDFDVRDAHVAQLVAAVGPQLISLKLGNSNTGNGVWVTDAAVHQIVESCPNLLELALCSCTGVTSAAFAAIATRLEQLLVLHCTGHDRTQGKLNNKAVEAIAQGALPHLQQLYITDQPVSFGKVEHLMNRRRQLRVQAGDSDSDSMAWGCVLQEMGRNYGDGLYGNMW